MAGYSALEVGTARRTVPFSRGLFFGSAGLVLGVTLLALGAVEFYARATAPARAAAHLGRALLDAERRVDGIFGPVSQHLSLGIDWISAEQRLDSAESLRDYFGPLLSRHSFLRAVRIATESGESWRLERAPDAAEYVLLHSAVDAAGAERVRLGLKGRARAHEDAAPEPPPMAEAWHQGAVASYWKRGASDPAYEHSMFWTPPGRVKDEAVPIMTGAIAGSGPKGLTVLGFEVSLRPLFDLTTDPAAADVFAIITDGHGRLIGPPREALAMRAFTDSPELPDANVLAGHPLLAGLQAWQGRNEPPGAAFPDRSGYPRWWYAFQPAAVGADSAFLIGTGIPTERLLRLDRFLQAGILAAGLAGVLCAGAWSAWQGRRIAGPIAAFVQRVRSLDALGSSYGYWPRTRFREMNLLFGAFDEAVREFGQSRVTAIPARSVAAVALPEPDTVDAEYLAPELEELDENDGEAGVAPLLIAPQSAPAAPAPPEPAQAQPPEAFLQLLAGTRRQLRDLRADQERLRAELIATAEKMHMAQARQFAQRNALVELLAAGEVRNGEFLDAAQRLLAAASRTLQAARAGVWRVCPGDWNGAARYDDTTQSHTPGVALPMTEARLLAAALESSPLLSIRDAAGDPRAGAFRAIAPVGGAAPGAVLAAAIFEGDRLTAMLAVEHAGGPRRWESDEESFIMALAEWLAPRFHDRAGESAKAGRETASRREIASELFEEAPVFRAMVESAGALVLAVGPDGRITYVNAACEAAYGRDASTLLGRSLTEIALDHGQADMRALRSVLDDHEARTYETEHRRADGSGLRVRATMSALEEEAGVVTGAVCVAMVLPPPDLDETL